THRRSTQYTTVVSPCFVPQPLFSDFLHRFQERIRRGPLTGYLQSSRLEGLIPNLASRLASFSQTYRHARPSYTLLCSRLRNHTVAARNETRSIIPTNRKGITILPRRDIITTSPNDKGLYAAPILLCPAVIEVVAGRPGGLLTMTGLLGPVAKSNV